MDSGSGSVQIGLDANRLTEIFTHIETESVILEFSGEFEFFIVKPEGENGHTCFIAPMRLKS